MPELEELITGYQDPETDAERKQIWDKIMRGPREREDELVAKGWKDRYGITEKSGKLARVFAGLGEAGRTISQRKNEKFTGIADAAKEQGLKEYQAEIGPLQRELGVLSTAKNVANKLAVAKDKADLDRQVKLYSESWKAAKSEAERARIDALTPGMVKKQAADLGLVQTKTSDLLAAGGLKGDAANAHIQAGMSPEQQQGINRVLFGNTEATSMGKLMGNPKRFETTVPGAPRVTTSMRPTLSGTGVNGMPTFENRESTSTSMGAPRKVIDNEKLTNAAEEFQKRMGLIPQEATAAAPIEFRTPSGTTHELTKQPGPVRRETTTYLGKTISKPALEPKIKDGLSGLFPDVDWNHPESTPKIYENTKYSSLPKPPTMQEQAAINSTNGLKRLAQDGIDLYVKGQLSNVVGPIGQVKGWVSRARGKSPTAETFLSQQTKNNFSEYVRALSGMASTTAENTRYKGVVPVEGDNENIFMQKALAATVAASQSRWIAGLGLPPAKQEELFSDPAILGAPKDLATRAMEHLSAAKSAFTTGRPQYEVDGKVYKTASAQRYINHLLSDVNADMQDGYWRVFPDGGGYGPPVSARKK